MAEELGAEHKVGIGHNKLPQGALVRKAIERLEPYEAETAKAKKALKDARAEERKIRKSISNELNVQLKWFDLARELTKEPADDKDATNLGADGVRQLVCCVAAMDEHNQFDWVKQVEIDDTPDA